MRNGRILVMDDHKDIRYIFSILLNRSNYEVEVAEDGNKAIELFNRSIEEERLFDAIILDLNVPGGMGGAEATEKLLEIDPETKVIWCSGRIDHPIMINYKKYGVVSVIHKPFNNDDIYEALSLAISSN
jgi:DNA-binding NtrC family response regulator